MLEKLTKLLVPIGRAHPWLRWPLLALLLVICCVDELCRVLRRAADRLRADAPQYRRHAPRRALAASLVLVLCLGMLPVSARADEAAWQSTCPHDLGQHEDCGFAEAVEAQPCTHTEHTADCGYAVAVEGKPCDKDCAEVAAEENIVHVEGCAYALTVEAQDCGHTEHDADCGFAEAVAAQPCTHTHNETCGGVEPKAPPAPEPPRALPAAQPAPKTLAADAEAEVSWTLTGGTVGSGTLEAAFAAFSSDGTSSGGTITVNRDFTAATPNGNDGFYLNNNNYAEDTLITLDLNGKNVDLGSTGIRVRTGTLTVAGTGTLTSTGIALLVGYLSDTKSKLILSRGDVTGDPAVEVQNGTTFEMSGGSLTGTGSTALSVEQNGKAVITGGSVTGGESNGGIINLSTNAALTLGTEDSTVSTDSPLLTASGEANIVTKIIYGLDGSKVNYYDGKLVAGKGMTAPIGTGMDISGLTLPENYILHTRRDETHATTILETAQDNAELKALTLNEWNSGMVPVTLSPAFASRTEHYTATAAVEGQRSLTFRLTPADDYIQKIEYKVDCGGFVQARKLPQSTDYIADLTVKDGENTCTLRVTAENTNIIKDYIVTVTVTPKPHTNHPVCGLSCTHTSSHAAVTYTKLTRREIDGTLSAGDYYLDGNLTAENNIYINGDVNLCLNGYTLDMQGYKLIQIGGTLNLSDCKTGGKILRSVTKNSHFGSLLQCGGYSSEYTATLNLYGGTLESRVTAENMMGVTALSIDERSMANLYGGEVTQTIGAPFDNAISNSGTLNLHGGTVSNPTGVAIFTSGSLTLSGSPTITAAVDRYHISAYSSGNTLSTIHAEAYTGGQLHVKSEQYSGEFPNVVCLTGTLIWCKADNSNKDSFKISVVKFDSETVESAYDETIHAWVVRDVGDTPAVHVPVTGITGVPTTATVGTPLALTGTVDPENATNKAIVWSVKSAGTTGATIIGATLSTTAAGTATVTATITNGATADTNYTQDFTIVVTETPAPHVHDGVTFEPWSSESPSGSDTYHYFLHEDMTGNLYVPEGLTLNLCLNGYALDAEGSGDGSTIEVEGTLNLYDCNGSHSSHTITVNGASHTINGGLVTGGTGRAGSDGATSGGGVYIGDAGRMTLHGGTIAGNTANSGAGGGMYVTGTFTMEGGAISYNTVTDGNGGGLCVGGTARGGSTVAVGTAILNGGTISHNTAGGNGGGVRVTGSTLNGRHSTLTLSGTVIEENTARIENGIHSSGAVILDSDCANQSITGLGTAIAVNSPLAAGTQIALNVGGAEADTVLVTGVTTQAQADMFTLTGAGADTAVLYDSAAQTIKLITYDRVLSAPLSQEEVDSAFGPGNATFVSPDKVVINQDLELEDTIQIETTVTVDLNGHTITGATGNDGNGKPALTVDGGATLTIVDGAVIGGAGSDNNAGNGGTGGPGVTGPGSIIIGTDGAVTGGNGGSGTTIGGDGGNGATIDGGSITVDGSATGGNGGSGTGIGQGGNGGNGLGGSGSVSGSGSAIGGNGGNAEVEGGGGNGGAALGGGVTGDGSITTTPGKNGLNAKVVIAGNPGTTVKIPDPGKAAEAVLTPEEKGNDKITGVTVTLTVENKTAEKPDSAMVEDVLKAPGTKADTVGAYFNIVLEKTIKETDKDDVTTPVTETTGGKITVTITIPTDMRGGSNYVIIRVHEGSAETITPTQSGDDLTFETDKFSTYAIAYQKAVTPEPPSGGSAAVTTYTITATAGEGGSISPQGNVRVNRNDSQTFTVKADAGYEIADVLVDGERVGVVATYTFEKVTARHTIEAQFRKEVKNSFTDVNEENWFYDAVLDMCRKGILEGTASDKFSPYLNTDRATMVAALWRMAGSPSAKAASTFPDVPADAWYAKAVAWGAEKGIVKGYGNGSFGPDDLITREQMATILWRYAGSEKVLDYEGTGRFTDTQDISPWASYAVTWALSEGILTGKGGGLLDPGGEATRAEAAVMLARFLSE